jgi:hypothetical protein
MMQNDDIQLFEMKIDDNSILILKERIRTTNWPSKELVEDRSPGMQLENKPEIFAEEMRAVFKPLRQAV